MKVYVTQGHEKGIGLEVFVKTCLLLKQTDLEIIKILAFKDSVVATLKALNLPYEIAESSFEVAGTIIQAEWLTATHHSQSFTSLELGMKLSESSGVLYTLPTSKDQFPGSAGHTEYFRSFYHHNDLGMFFSSPRMQVLLLSDHVAVSELSSVLTVDLLYQRMRTALISLQNWNWPIKRILISGLNPHAGENGLIGNEDQRITQVIRQLRDDFDFDMSGPLPGDTMVFEQNSPHDLLVYLSHDQGLGVFKSLQGFIGSNITLGLPYPRFSPDHGTSFGLYGLNKADYRGCSFSLKQAVDMLKRISHGQNSSHKSQGS